MVRDGLDYERKPIKSTAPAAAATASAANRHLPSRVTYRRRSLVASAAPFGGRRRRPRTRKINILLIFHDFRKDHVLEVRFLKLDLVRKTWFEMGSIMNRGPVGHRRLPDFATAAAGEPPSGNRRRKFLVSLSLVTMEAAATVAAASHRM